MACGISTLPFGRLTDGRMVSQHTLDNGLGLTLSAIDYGGIVNRLTIADAQGRPRNVVLGLPSLDAYVKNTAHLGTIVGRYANRIARGRYVLDGREHQLAVNDGANTLHGGPAGFGACMWTPHEVKTSGGFVALEFARTSPDGEEGFPGELQVNVRYTLSPGNAWRIDYRATTTAATVVNLTHHDYFNLAGAGTVLDHRLTLAASQYLPIDTNLIPIEAEDVTGTPFDFRTPTRIAERMQDDDEQLNRARGYDHNWVLDRVDDELAFAARLEHEPSGRTMEVWTTEPGIQFYSGNFLDGSLTSASGEPIRRGDGLCLETQHFPDSPNQPEHPSTVLRPGTTFLSTTEYRFGVRRALEGSAARS
jgi:aldose 1-epimerase